METVIPQDPHGIETLSDNEQLTRQEASWLQEFDEHLQTRIAHSRRGQKTTPNAGRQNTDYSHQQVAGFTHNWTVEQANRAEAMIPCFYPPSHPNFNPSQKVPIGQKTFGLIRSVVTSRISSQNLLENIQRRLLRDYVNARKTGNSYKSF